MPARSPAPWTVGYQAADGGYVELSSPEDRISVEGRNCGNPVVRGGRLVSKDCWGNGHRDADLGITWRVEGDVIVSEGKRYTRLPTPPGRTAEAKPSPGPQAAMRVDPTGRPWRHNGSIVMADPGTGIIAYLEPKASLRPSVDVGTVLFRGELRDHKPIRGTAYAYKAGCPAAPYPVRGTYSDLNTLTLHGAGPVRSGCEVVGYSDRSPHAVLKFTYLLDDSIGVHTMNEVISCTLLGVASFTLFDLQGNPSGREVWTGVRVRTANGKTRFFTGMPVEAEAALILRAAMENGEIVELWLSGKDDRAYPYGIRTATEEWYGDAMAPHLRGLGIKFLVISIIALPFLGMGLLILPASISFFMSASAFSARHSRATFERGYEDGVLGRKVAPTAAAHRQAA